MTYKIRNGDYVKVEWIDSAINGRWVTIEEANAIGVIECITIGHLLSKDRDVVRVIGTIGDGEQGMHLVVIPRVCVTSIARLTV